VNSRDFQLTELMADAKKQREEAEKQKRYTQEWPGFKDGVAIPNMPAPSIMAGTDIYNVLWFEGGEQQGNRSIASVNFLVANF
jgi:hypothetical protein